MSVYPSKPHGATPETREIMNVVNQIRPYLARREPSIQGAVLAELLSLWLAGHYQGGAPLIEQLLSMHTEKVRELMVININLLRAREIKGTA